MLHDEIAQQRRFSRTRFSDEIKMLATIGKRKTDGLLACKIPDVSALQSIARNAEKEICRTRHNGPTGRKQEAG
jgi:hypothetical protein